MRVLLVYKDSFAQDRMAICCLSASLKKYGHEVALVIQGVTPDEKMVNTVRDFAPHVVGYSAMTGEHDSLLRLNRELRKDFSFTSVFGGPHATFFNELIDEEGVDAICTGEGDEAFPEFCRRLENGEDYWKTPSFLVKHIGETHKNPLMPLVDVSALPFPDHEILYEADPGVARTGNRFVMAARGCPYKCTYCFNVEYNESYKGKGRVLRWRTPEQVIQEIEQIRDRYPMEHVAFVDDIFPAKPRKWFDEFCALYKERIAIPFDGTVRANSLNEDVLAQLSDAGLSFVWMGVESGDEKAANEILLREMNNEQILSTSKMLHRHGVGILTLNIIGLPVPDPYESDLKTLDLNIEIAPTYGGSSILYPFPGTPIERYARENGYLNDEPVYMETYKRSSMLKFSSPREKRKIENLHKLFGLVVSFPILRPAVGFLSSLPFNGFYRAIYYLWYGYCLKVKLNPINWRREGTYYVGLFFRMFAKS